MMLEGKPITSNIAKFQVYLSAATAGEHQWQGVLYNIDYQFSLPFASVHQFLSSLDQLFDYVNFPMAAQQKRSFQKKPAQVPSQLPSNYQTGLPTAYKTMQPQFLLQVQTRQNTTWQGEVCWLPAKRRQLFRSDLELLHLMLLALEVQTVTD